MYISTIKNFIPNKSFKFLWTRIWSDTHDNHCQGTTSSARLPFLLPRPLSGELSVIRPLPPLSHVEPQEPNWPSPKTTLPSIPTPQISPNPITNWSGEEWYTTVLSESKEKFISSVIECVSLTGYKPTSGRWVVLVREPTHDTEC